MAVVHRLAALIAGMAITLAGCSTGPGASAPAPTPSVPALQELPTLTLQATVPTSSGTLAIVATADAIWVLGHQNPAVLRIDPLTNSVTATVAVGDGFANGLGLAGGRLWTFHQTAGEVVGIDPKTATIVAEVPGGQDGDVFWVGDDSAWLLTGGSLVRVDGATSKASVLSLAEPCPVAGTAAASGFIWFAAADGGICKVDAKSGAVAGRGSGAGIGAGMQIVAGAPWVPTGDGGLVILDPAAVSVSTTVPPPANGTFHGSLYAVGHPDENAVVAGNPDGTGGWVRYTGGAVAHVTLAGAPKMELYAGFPPDTLPGRVVEAFGSLWVANFGAGTVERYALPAP
jgi:hypothetical protein